MGRDEKRAPLKTPAWEAILCAEVKANKLLSTGKPIIPWPEIKLLDWPILLFI